MLNHSFGRYGLTIDGSWVANTEYADSKTCKILVSEVIAMVKEYKSTPGLLLFLLGMKITMVFFGVGRKPKIFLLKTKNQQ